MEVKLLKPSGYCFGVSNAINKVIKLRNDNPSTPIYVYGMLVHNSFVVDLLDEYNIVTLSRNADLSKLEKSIIVSTAHGISNENILKIKEAGHDFIDATCPIVFKSFTKIKNELQSGNEVIYLGKHNHPESMAAISISNKIHLVTKEEDCLLLDKKIKYTLTDQTTMTRDEVLKIYDFLIKNGYNVLLMDDVCNATTVRQENLIKEANNYDAIFVVGDHKSNNNTKLYNLAKSLNKNSYFIENKSQIDSQIKYKKCLVTSGTSTPQEIIDEVVEYLKSL